MTIGWIAHEELHPMKNADQNSDPQRRAWTVNSAARRISLSRSTIYKLMDQGLLASVKVGGRRLIRDEELEKLIAGRTSPS
jgi:excisionase family DNA binding protein